jgi:hypothetical protein
MRQIKANQDNNYQAAKVKKILESLANPKIGFGWASFGA